LLFDWTAMQLKGKDKVARSQLHSAVSLGISVQLCCISKLAWFANDNCTLGRLVHYAAAKDVCTSVLSDGADQELPVVLPLPVTASLLAFAPMSSWLPSRASQNDKKRAESTILNNAQGKRCK